VDGLTLHPITGRPTHYTSCGTTRATSTSRTLNPLAVDKIAARHVVHWFKFRPGQVRGVPVFTSSLDLFTELRAFRGRCWAPRRSPPTYAAVLEQDRETGAYDTGRRTPTASTGVQARARSTGR
jgi:capsid protein